MIKAARLDEALAERRYLLPPYPAVYLETHITNLIGDYRDDKAPEHLDAGQAIYAQYGPGHATTHAHPVDQWQIYFEGDARVAKKPADGISIQYTDEWVPYGPIEVGEGGFALLALWPRPCAEVYAMPEHAAQIRAGLQGKPHRVMLAAIDVESDRPSALAERALIEEGPVWARLWRLPAGGSFTTPDPAAGGGQFWVPLRGSVVHTGREYPARSTIYVGPRDGAIEIRAGAGGAEVVGVQYRPQP